MGISELLTHELSELSDGPVDLVIIFADFRRSSHDFVDVYV